MSTGNPFLDRLARETADTQSPAYRRSKKQEKRIARKLGAQTVSGSGAGAIKGDVRLRHVTRLEAKTTDHKSFRVTSDMFEKLQLNAAGADELPVIAIEMPGPDGRLQTFAIMLMSDLEEVLSRQK